MKKKIISFCLSAILLSGSFILPANASTLSKHNTKIKLQDVCVTVPYDEDKIDIKYKKTDTEYEAQIFDKATHKHLTSVGEELDKKNNSMSTQSTALSGYYTKKVYKEVDDAFPAVARLYAVLNCYSYDSFRQINSISDTYWSEQSSGDWELKQTHSTGIITDLNSAGVGTKVEISGTANVVITTTTSTSGSFSISVLEGLGFSVSNSSGDTYYARMPIDADFGYSLY